LFSGVEAAGPDEADTKGDLVKTFTAAPNWLIFTAVGSAQTVVGVLLLHLGQRLAMSQSV